MSENKRPTGFYVFILSYAHMLCQATEYFSSTLAKNDRPAAKSRLGGMKGHFVFVKSLSQPFSIFSLLKNPIFLSPPSLHDTSPYHKRRHKMGFVTPPRPPWLPCAKGAGCRRQTEGLYRISLHFFGEKMQREFCGFTLIPSGASHHLPLP